MSVLEAVAAKARALSSGSVEAETEDAPSRVSARERLQLLGIGGGTLTRFPVQSLPDSHSSANSPLDTIDDPIFRPDTSKPTLDFRNSTGGIKRKTRGVSMQGDSIKDKTGRWKTDLKAIYRDEHASIVGNTEFSPNINLEEDTLKTTDVVTGNQQRTSTLKRRRTAAQQLKQFHVFSLSLVAVLVCSVWMFGYAMLA